MRCTTSSASRAIASLTAATAGTTPASSARIVWTIWVVVNVSMLVVAEFRASVMPISRISMCIPLYHQHKIGADDNGWRGRSWYHRTRTILHTVGYVVNSAEKFGRFVVNDAVAYLQQV